MVCGCICQEVACLLDILHNRNVIGGYILYHHPKGLVEAEPRGISG